VEVLDMTDTTFATAVYARGRAGLDGSRNAAEIWWV